MESNGEGNKIQVSESTATLLIAGGKGRWLSKRENMIVAKGKGDMQTYWVNAPTRSASSVAASQSEHRNFSGSDPSTPDNHSPMAENISSTYVDI